MVDYDEEHDKMPIGGYHNYTEAITSDGINLTEEDVKFQQDLDSLMTIGDGNCKQTLKLFIFNSFQTNI